MTSSDDDPSRCSTAGDTVATDDPDAVTVDELVDDLVCAEEEPRQVALETYDELASAVESIPGEVAVRLEPLLSADDTATRRGAVAAVDALVTRHPEAFATLRPELESIGSDIADPCRERAVLALSKLAIDRPDLGAPATETLVDMCHSRIDRGDGPAVGGPSRSTAPAEPIRESPEQQRRNAVRVHAVAGLTRIAAARPDAVADHVSRIGDLLDYETDHRLVRGGACEVLEAMAEPHPDSVEPFAPSLASLVATSTERAVVWRAADALEALAERSPTAVGTATAAHAPAFGSRLESSHEGLRGVGVGFLTYAAEADPSSVEPFVPRFRALLDDDAAAVRANAALALGLVDAGSVRDELAELADTDPDEDVRRIARRIVERVDGETPESDGGAH